MKLAQVLHISDVANVVGDERITSTRFGKAAHASLPAVADALARYPLTEPDKAIDFSALGTGTSTERLAKLLTEVS